MGVPNYPADQATVLRDIRNTMSRNSGLAATERGVRSSAMTVSYAQTSMWPSTTSTSWEDLLHVGGVKTQKNITVTASCLASASDCSFRIVDDVGVEIGDETIVSAGLTQEITWTFPVDGSFYSVAYCTLQAKAQAGGGTAKASILVAAGVPD